jgi:hypothetical protein
LEEKIIKSVEPELRRSGTWLFSELETWDFSLSRLDSYKEITKALRQIDGRLHGQTKFWTMAQYRLADVLYIAAPPGVVRRGETPPGWGLLELTNDPCAGRPDGESAVPCLRVRIDAPHLDAKAAYRQRLLRNIAIAATRDSMRGLMPRMERARKRAETLEESPSDH